MKNDRIAKRVYLGECAGSRLVGGDIVPLSVASRSNFLIIIIIYVYIIIIIIIISLGVQKRENTEK